MKYGYYVQLHLHTWESSRCGRMTGAELARACKALGYDLVAITDHFFNANIRCDRTLPWKEQVDCLFRGYYAAKAEGDRIGLEVIPGWETLTDGGPELLTYGLGEDFLLANPDIAELPLQEYMQRVRDAGGKMIHAHPYRRAPHLKIFEPEPSVGAYEVYNGGNGSPEYNRLAYEAAARHGLLEFAGSDAHEVGRIHYGAMCFERPVHNIHEIFAETEAGRARIFEALPPL